MVYAADNVPTVAATSEAGGLSSANADAPAAEAPDAGNAATDGKAVTSDSSAAPDKGKTDTGAQTGSKDDKADATKDAPKTDDAQTSGDQTKPEDSAEEEGENFTRTIHFIMADDGTTKDSINEAAKDDKFAAVAIPAMSGYTAYLDGKIVNSIPAAEDASAAVKDLYVVYAKSGMSAAKVSVTIDGDEIVSITAVGKNGDSYPAYIDKVITPAVESLKKAGYTASTNYYKASDFTFKADGGNDVVIAMKPELEKIDSPKTTDDVMSNGKKYPEGLALEDLQHTWTRTIHYVKADDTEDDITDNEEIADSVIQEVRGKRTATVNHVTDEVTYDDWKIADGRTGKVNHVTGEVTYGDWKTTDKDKEFAEVKSPEIKGFTANEDVVAKTEVSDDTDDETDVYITYTADDQKAVIKFTDKDGNAIADSVTLKGKSGEIMGVADKDGKKTLYSTKDMIQQLTNKGYKFVKDDFPTTEKDGVFDTDAKVDQAYSVVMEPIVETVTSDKPKTSKDQMNPNGDKYPAGLEKKNLEHTVTRTIHFVDKNKKKLKDDVVQVVTFTRQAVVNHVTGKVTYGDWTSKNASFALVQAPAIDGYKTNVKAVDTVSVKPTDENSEETILYTATSEGNGTDTTGAKGGTASGSGAGISQSGKTQTGDTPVVPYVAGAGAAIAALFAALKKKKAPKKEANKN